MVRARRASVNLFTGKTNCDRGEWAFSSTSTEVKTASALRARRARSSERENQLTMHLTVFPSPFFAFFVVTAHYHQS